MRYSGSSLLLIAGRSVFSYTLPHLQDHLTSTPNRVSQPAGSPPSRFPLLTVNCHSILTKLWLMMGASNQAVSHFSLS